MPIESFAPWRQQPRDLRKRRTRAHVIADLSVNHVERFVLLRGHVAERPRHDYGYDMQMFTFDTAGQFENGFVKVQLKATDDLDSLLIHNGRVISFPIDRKDLNHWLAAVYPVILIVFDARKMDAYWLYVQRYWREKKADDSRAKSAVIKLHIPLENRLTEDAIDQFAAFKTSVLGQLGTRIDYHA